MTTNVPSITIGPSGIVVPAESAILAGVQADMQSAFGGDLNPSLVTPQGQLAQSQTAIIGACNDSLLAIANGFDPALASGRFQDALARIYFLERIAATSTVVTANCYGLVGVFIPIGAQAVAADGNIYFATEAGTIPVGGFVTLTFACATTGPIACPAGSLTSIYQSIPGWDSITNPADGVQGNNVETRADFEFRRRQSVALNATGQTGAVLAAVLAVPGVLDAYALENPLAVTSGAVFTGSIAGTVLTASGVTGTIAQGMMLSGGTTTSGTAVTQQISGTTGGAGTYAVNISGTVASATLTAAFGGVPLVPHSIYVAAYGGAAADIGAVILRKKNPGCDYNGSTTVSVADTNPAYTAGFPAYNVSFQIPTPTAVKFAIAMQANGNVPSNAVALIRAAVMSAFNGTDGGLKARIASSIFASRFYAGIASIGAWAQIYSILLGITAANQNSILMRMDQIPKLVATDIAVTFS
jgi:hypothetical protein